ncbi:S-adenosyl-L-methionine-dependent methyltransferase [Echria macrotheca]|uniref:S-adenosyl-L-methionine-dependent methyltransferase n=1 Tax=Echria macrotheca TaxID=438768 RepID=A0AAJ0FG85_9PEZI|nr:S-adenosyl-L-methionine-dependent methyltransferase [Echria macrotheca]
MRFLDDIRTMDIAIKEDAANEQHYEVSPGVLAAALGPRMKYSSCLFPTGKETIAEAEDAMLESYVEKGEFRDGMRVLDLGCGWGAGVLYLAERFPKSQIVGFSNSKAQKAHIDKRAEEKGLTNVEVITGNMANYEFEHESFDRVLSIEMFEHMKNLEEVFAKMARALKPGGKAFIHVFGHKDSPYHFEDGWMTRNFFTGGMMPSLDLYLYFQDDLKIQKHWFLSGTHYSKTLNAWLRILEANKKKALPEFVAMYGEANATVWYNRWRVFYLASAEFFGYGGGDYFGVCHYLFEKPVKTLQGTSGQSDGREGGA